MTRAVAAARRSWRSWARRSPTVGPDGWAGLDGSLSVTAKTPGALACAQRTLHRFVRGELCVGGPKPLHKDNMDLMDVLDDEINDLAGCRGAEVPPSHGAVRV